MKTLICPALLCLALLAGCGSDKKTASACPDDMPPTCFNGMIDPAPPAGSGQYAEQCDPGDGKTNYDFGGKDCSDWGAGNSGSLKCDCCQVVTDLCTTVLQTDNAVQSTPPIGGSGG